MDGKIAANQILPQQMKILAVSDKCDKGLIRYRQEYISGKFGL
jgi:hypothetical protein